jgi:hypothetical protein
MADNSFRRIIASGGSRILDSELNVTNMLLSILHTRWHKGLCFANPWHHGLHIRTQLSKVLASAYPHISIRVVFRPSCRLSSFFPFKDRIPIALRSHVVYQFTCQCCSALYVGQTRRHIHTCISEHMGVSPLTGKERSISTMSSILAHKPVSASNFKILSWSTSEWDLLIRESLLISQLNPVLNANIRSTHLELF